jgi:hypothetical protein
MGCTRTDEAMRRASDTDTENVRYSDQFDQVVKFFGYMKAKRRTFPSLYTEEYFIWKVRNNPFGKSACYIRYRNEIPVSHCSITAKPLNPELGAGYGCGELGDTHTHPGHMKQGNFGALGSRVIRDFDSEGDVPGERLIYGLPNENALPGWIRHCDCELDPDLGIVEYERGAFLSPGATAKKFIGWGMAKIRRRIAQYSVCPNNDLTRAEIDEMWAQTHERKHYIIQKDGLWWAWRYRDSTEKYKTHALREASGKATAFVISKISWAGIRVVQICDVFTRREGERIPALGEFIKTVLLPTDKVIVWAQEATGCPETLVDLGFTKKRDIMVVFYKNKAHRQLKERDGFVNLSLGDSDNA